MPKLDDILEKKKTKSFKKVSYKPWESTFIESGGENREANTANEEQVPTKNPEKINVQLVEPVKDKSEQELAAKPSFVSKKVQEVDDVDGKYDFSNIFRLNSIVGKHKKILFFLANREMQRDEDFLICVPLSSSEIAVSLGEKQNYVNTVIGRLRNMGVLRTFKKSQGPGGHSIHGIPMYVVKEIEKAKGQV